MVGIISILSRQAWLKALARPGGNVTGLTRSYQRTRRKAAGAAQGSGSQTYRVSRVLYESASPDRVLEVKELSRVAARALKIDYFNPGRYEMPDPISRGVFRCDEQAAPGCDSLRATEPATA